MAEFNLEKKKSQRYTDSISKNHVNENLSEKELSEIKRIVEKLNQNRMKEALIDSERKITNNTKVQSEKEPSSNRKLLILIASLALLLFTNPDLEMHQNKVKSFVLSTTKENIESIYGTDKGKANGWVTLFTTLGINAFIPNMIERENYIFFSFTILKKNGTSQTVGIGVLGNVFLYREIEDSIYNKILP